MSISAAAALCAGNDSGAEAYTIAGWKYDHLDITYDHPLLGEGLRIWAEMSAIRDGGYRAEDADIRWWRDVGPWPGTRILGVAAPIHGPDGIVRYCLVAFHPSFGENPPLGIVAHEIGHCLGLEHTTVPDQLMSEWCCGLPGPDDRAGIQAIYGPPDPSGGLRHKKVVPGVARD